MTFVEAMVDLIAKWWVSPKWLYHVLIYLRFFNGPLMMKQLTLRQLAPKRVVNVVNLAKLCVVDGNQSAVQFVEKGSDGFSVVNQELWMGYGGILIWH